MNDSIPGGLSCGVKWVVQSGSVIRKIALIGGSGMALIALGAATATGMLQSMPLRQLLPNLAPATVVVASPSPSPVQGAATINDPIPPASPTPSPSPSPLPGTPCTANCGAPESPVPGPLPGS